MDLSARSLLKSKTWISLAGLYAKIINFSSDWVKFRFLYARIPDIHTHTHTHTPHMAAHTHTQLSIEDRYCAYVRLYTGQVGGGGVTPLV